VGTTARGLNHAQIEARSADPQASAGAADGKVTLLPWAIDGDVVSRPGVTVTLAADHRVTDGRRGSIFLSAVDRLLQEPEKL